LIYKYELDNRYRKGKKKPDWIVLDDDPAPIFVLFFSYYYRPKWITQENELIDRSRGWWWEITLSFW
jgi:hypothetical protein